MYTGSGILSLLPIRNSGYAQFYRVGGTSGGFKDQQGIWRENNERVSPSLNFRRLLETQSREGLFFSSEAQTGVKDIQERDEGGFFRCRGWGVLGWGPEKEGSRAGVERMRRGKDEKTPQPELREAPGSRGSGRHRGAFVGQTDSGTEAWEKKKKGEGAGPLSGSRSGRRHHKARGEIATGAR